jgi:uncharacterized protein (TIGR02271 family)
MLDNTNTPGPGNMAGQQFLEGTPVFDAAGEKVGSVSEHNVQGGYLVVHKGIFRKDIHVPLSAIGRGDDDGVYLNMYKDELRDQSWDTPPDSASMSRTSTAPPLNTPAEGSMRGHTPLASTAEPVNPPGTALDMGRPGAHQMPAREGDTAASAREEEPQSINVPVTREEVTVERVPRQGSSQPIGPDAFQERDIEVPVMGEEVTAEKWAKAGEEIRLHKQQVTENQRFDDTVRKEHVNVEGQDQQGGVPLTDSEEEPPANL